MATATLAPPRVTSFERHDVRLRFIHSLDDLNFFDNFTHVRPLSRRGLRMFLQMAGRACEQSGVVRHWRKVLAFPFLLIGGLLARRRRWVCLAIWEIRGWSIYATGRKLA